MIDFEWQDEDEDVDHSIVRVVDEKGTRYGYWEEGKFVLHREDGPAAIISSNVRMIAYLTSSFVGHYYPEMTEMWFRRGKAHRLDGPAVESPDGEIKEWFVGGMRHRDKGPARVFRDILEEWYFNDLLHRIDGPARTYKREGGEDSEWYLNGIFHRIDGKPVCSNYNNRREWRVCGILHRIGGPARIFHTGEENWFQYGRLHREDGPAEIYEFSRKFFFHGERHRQDGPAETTNTCKRWFFNGELHRTDGPAVVWKDGEKEWWVDGERITPPFLQWLKSFKRPWGKSDE